MSWIANFVRPKLREWVGRKEVPDNLWHKCPNCGQMIFHRDLAKNLRVCQQFSVKTKWTLLVTCTWRLPFFFVDGFSEQMVSNRFSTGLIFGDQKRGLIHRPNPDLRKSLEWPGSNDRCRWGSSLRDRFQKLTCFFVSPLRDHIKSI